MRRFIALTAIFMMAFGVNAGSVTAQGNCTHYSETNYDLCGDFQTYWNTNGGLPVFGYPISDAFSELQHATGETYDVQYFERERFEHHPGNANTEYEVLLGRLGDEVLQAQGRNWTTFPKADPSAVHYMPETEQAIASEFWEHWRSHGLDLGDDGVSFRESLALFGYPISGAQMETNANGDTMLTQWFERARFEHHDGQVLLGMLGSETLAIPGVSNPVDASNLAQLRRVTSKFHEIESAQAAGWDLVEGLDHCFSNPGVGAMGIHYINVDLLDTTLDPISPEAMVYQHGPDGELTPGVGAVEWIVPVDAWEAEGHDELPEVMGHHLHLNEALGVYVLHAWIGLENPAGIFEDWNPDVSCAPGT